MDRLRSRYGKKLMTLQDPLPVLEGASKRDWFKGAGNSVRVPSEGESGDTKSAKRTSGEAAIASPIAKRLKRSVGDGEETPTSYTWFAFPSVSEIAEASEGELKEVGLGYRASSVRLTAQLLLSNGNWHEEGNAGMSVCH
eukprot:GHVN01082374.1.p1 GENE.GHVN01082374.1~~GHVN01082374.1.p1  ORF type:complete len:140 (+),score=15.81 GHVN01082374.1:436-855(+)